MEVSNTFALLPQLVSHMLYHTDKGTGGKAKIEELWKLIGEDKDLNTLSKEEKKALIKILKDFRKDKSESVYINNRAAAKDIMGCADVIMDVVSP